MARIRSIHPGIWRDKSFVKVSAYARLLYIGILNECDDKGAFKWEPIELKMNLMPVDNVDVDALLAELSAVDRIRMYEVAGQEYGAVRNFGKFQSPKKPNDLYPMPDQYRIYAATGKASTELDEDEGGGGTEPEQVKPKPVPPSSEPTELQLTSVPINSENPRQMEGRGEGEEEEKERSSLRSPRADDGDFETFWRAYPRKVGKGAVSRMWPSVMKKTSVSVLLQAISLQRWDHRERFIPHPATWLNQERWLDEATSGDPVLRAVGLTDSGEFIQKPDDLPNWLQLPGGRA